MNLSARLTRMEAVSNAAMDFLAIHATDDADLEGQINDAILRAAPGILTLRVQVGGISRPDIVTTIFEHEQALAQMQEATQ